MDTPSTGAVLLDQTMLCEGARLLDGAPGSRGRSYSGSVDQVIHLGTLLDAVLLYERLYTLKAEPPPDADRLALRRELLSQGIVQELDPTATSPQLVANITGELTRYLQAVSEQPVSGPRWTGSDVFASPDFVGNAAAYLLGDESKVASTAGLRKLVEVTAPEREGPVELGRSPSPDDLMADPLWALGQEILGNIGYFHSGSAASGVSFLRTFVYWRLASHLGIPQYPSLVRLPQQYLLDAHLQRSLQETVYDAVASAFHATVAEVYDYDDPVPVYLPPALTLFLDGIRLGRTVGEQLRAMRVEFQPVRRRLAQLQEDTSELATLEQLRKSKRRLREVLAELQPAASAGGEGVVGHVIDLAPEIAKVAANPLNVAAYSSAFAAQPAKWIRNWWRKRPYRFAFQLRSRLEAVAGYRTLLEESISVRISVDEIEKFTAAYEEYLAKYQTYGPMRRVGPGPS